MASELPVGGPPSPSSFVGAPNLFEINWLTRPLCPSPASLGEGCAPSPAREPTGRVSEGVRADTVTAADRADLLQLPQNECSLNTELYLSSVPLEQRQQQNETCACADSGLPRPSDGIEGHSCFGPLTWAILLHDCVRAQRLCESSQ